MAVVPFPERAMAHWNDEVERAHTDLLTALDVARNKADEFITVSALATTLFAVLAHHIPSDRSEMHPVGAVLDNDIPPEVQPGTVQNIVSDLSLRPSSKALRPYPDADPDGIVVIHVNGHTEVGSKTDPSP